MKNPGRGKEIFAELTPDERRAALIKSHAHSHPASQPQGLGASKSNTRSTSASHS